MKYQGNNLKTASISFFTVLMICSVCTYPKSIAAQEPTNSEDIECNWKNLSDASLTRVETQSAEINGKIYIFGGFSNSWKISDLTEIYDSSNDSWSIGTPVPTPISHAGIAVVDKEIWILGGFVGNNPGVATNKVQIYNTISDTWRDGPNLPNDRASGAAAQIENRLHFFGGLLPDRQTDVGEHYYILLNDLASGWKTAAALPNPRNHFSSAVVEGLIYAIGGQHGHDNGNVDLKLVHAYDFNTNTWIAKASLPKERSHFEPSTTVYDKKIIIAGGDNGNNNFDNTILQYDPLTDMWTELCLVLPYNLIAPVAKAISNKLFITTGGVDGTFNLIKNTYSTPLFLNNEVLGKNNNLPVNEDNVVIHPNPFKDSFNIVLSNNISFISNIKIFELTTGKVLKNDIVLNNELNKVFFNTNERGVYLAKITLNSGEILIKKIIKF